MTRDLVLGLEVVLPDGRVWNGLKTLRKDNRGYDLKQLFIGSEGTLGIVTAAALKLFPKPTQIKTVFLALESVEAAMTLYGRARRDCSDLLSAFELIPRQGVEIALEASEGLADPFDRRHPVYVLMEVSASGLVDLRALLERFLFGVFETGAALDGVLASSRGQAAQLWRIRETMVEAQSGGRRYLRTDVSVPISSLARLVTEAEAAVSGRFPRALVLAYGHVGDGNVHLNVVPPPDLDEEAVTAMIREAEPLVFEMVDRLDGSISAEHGIGRSKRRAGAGVPPPQGRLRHLPDPAFRPQAGAVAGGEGLCAAGGARFAGGGRLPPEGDASPPSPG